jgi:PleD family two-component response regulator
MYQKPIKILIVDDDNEVRKMYVETFKKNNFEVLESSDGLDGLQNAIANIPDIIFTGIIMPRMDGFTLTQELKKNTKTSKIPVVFSSHLGREADRKEAQRLGVEDFFVRDLDKPEEVVARIKHIINKSVFQLRFSETELDAPKLLKELKNGKKLNCNQCGEKVIMKIRIANLNKGEFNGKFICPKCKK